MYSPWWLIHFCMRWIQFSLHLFNVFMVLSRRKRIAFLFWSYIYAAFYIWSIDIVFLELFVAAINQSILVTFCKIQRDQIFLTSKMFILLALVILVENDVSPCLISPRTALMFAGTTIDFRQPLSLSPLTKLGPRLNYFYWRSQGFIKKLKWVDWFTPVLITNVENCKKSSDETLNELNQKNDGLNVKIST